MPNFPLTWPPPGLCEYLSLAQRISTNFLLDCEYGSKSRTRSIVRNARTPPMLIRMQSSLQLIPMFDLVDEVIEPSIVRKSRGGRLYCRIKSLLRTWLSRVPPLSSIRSTSNVALPDCTLEFACEFNVSHRDTGGGGSLAASEPPFKPPFEPTFEPTFSAMSLQSPLICASETSRELSTASRSWRSSGWVTDFFSLFPLDSPLSLSDE